MSSEKEQLEQALRELAGLRGLIRTALSRLSPTEWDPHGENYEQHELLAEGYEMAVRDLRAAIIPPPEPTQRQKMLGHTADMLGLDRGGHCTGHLAVLWDTAYEAGQKNALTPGPLL